MAPERPSRRQSPLVNALICGTQKGGTSALDQYLRAHPQIHLADRKELHFFDNDALFQIAEPDYNAYHAHFQPNECHQIVCECTPRYMYWHDAPRRIWDYNPRMRILVVLRNPIERAYSAWNMQRLRGWEPLSFREAIQAEPARLRASLPSQNAIFSYVDRGFYLEQLRRLWRCFSKDQVLALRTEDLRNRPQETLEAVCAFLEIEPPPHVEPRRVFAHPYESPMDRRAWADLRDIFEFEIRGLERALNWNCEHWLDERMADGGSLMPER